MRSANPNKPHLAGRIANKPPVCETRVTPTTSHANPNNDNILFNGGPDLSPTVVPHAASAKTDPVDAVVARMVTESEPVASGGLNASNLSPNANARTTNGKRKPDASDQYPTIAITKVAPKAAVYPWLVSPRPSLESNDWKIGTKPRNNARTSDPIEWVKREDRNTTARRAIFAVRC